MRSAVTIAASSVPAADLKAARRVLAMASEAIAALGQSFDGEFSQALDAILAIKGRVIVSGMGKSGHIARKIAATFASTGTPAHFVHPGSPATATWAWSRVTTRC